MTAAEIGAIQHADHCAIIFAQGARGKLSSTAASSAMPTITKRRTPIRRVLFPAIEQAAAEFQIHRVTLYRILKRQHPDHRNLRARYARFIKGAAK